jgi:hypothetical protein
VGIGFKQKFNFLSLVFCVITIILAKEAVFERRIALKSAFPLDTPAGIKKSYLLSIFFQKK